MLQLYILISLISGTMHALRRLRTDHNLFRLYKVQEGQLPNSRFQDLNCRALDLKTGDPLWMVQCSLIPEIHRRPQFLQEH